MSFRKPKSNAESHTKEWHAWIEQHRSELISIGLPAEVFLDESHWSDFLLNGHIHWHESSGFEFDQLSIGQLTSLHRFLDREYGTGHKWPLANWVRVRCGHM